MKFYCASSPPRPRPSWYFPGIGAVLVRAATSIVRRRELKVGSGSSGKPGQRDREQTASHNCSSGLHQLLFATNYGIKKFSFLPWAVFCVFKNQKKNRQLSCLLLCSIPFNEVDSCFNLLSVELRKKRRWKSSFDLPWSAVVTSKAMMAKLWTNISTFFPPLSSLPLKKLGPKSVTDICSILGAKMPGCETAGSSWQLEKLGRG